MILLSPEQGMDLAVKLAEGNPGAITVMRELMWYSHWFEMLQVMERNNIKGSEIWILYKDTYQQDIEKFAGHIKKLMKKDKEFRHFNV